MAKETVYNNTLVSGAADETLTYTRYIKDESSGKSTKELLDEKVNKTDQLGTTQIANKAVTTEKLADQSVGNSKIASDAVTYDKIKNGSVIPDKIGEGAVTTEKIETKAVTNEKIGDSAVDGRTIQEGVVQAKHLANESVTNAKIATDSISRDKLDPSIRKELTDTISAANAATSKADQATEDAKNATAAATAAKEAADNATQLATNATTASNQATELAKDATTKADDATARANEAAQKADDSREQTEQTLGTMQEVIDKVAIKDDEGTMIETPFRYIQSEEFIFAKVDANDKLLFGIQWDGTPKFGKTSAVEDRLQSQVTLLAERVATIMGDEDTTNVIDTMNELKKFFAEIENTKTLTSILANLNSLNTKFGEDIANLQETKVDKEEGKSLIEDEVKECFRIIENEEFIMAVVDSEDRVLLGIYRATGKPYYPLNEMYHVEQNEEFFALWQDSANHVLLGIRRDGQIIGEIHAVNALKQVISQLQSDLATLQEKVGTIDTNLKELLAVFSLQENEEYLAVEQDAEGKVLSATNLDGSHYSHNLKSETIDAKVDKEEDKSLIDAEFADAHSTLEDPEGRTEITTDAEGKVMCYRDANGKRHEHDMEVTNLDVSNLNLKGNSVNNIQDALKANGFNVKTPIDWSENNKIQIPEPRLAFVNITNIESMPTSKGQDMHAIFEFWDMQGNYFKKKVILNAQGNSSIGMPKKNFACDFCNDDWKGDDTFKIKFGNWVSQDSFHFKAFYADFFKGVSMVGYKLFNEIELTRSFNTNRIWKRALLPSADTIGFGTKGMESITDVNILIDNGARCYPDGFPCIVHLNGSFYGVFSWALKKHRDNYMQNKSKPENIQLDGDIYDTFSYNGNIDWDVVNGNKEASNTNMDGVEFRNPKSLICFDGSKYDGDTNRKELIDSSSDSYDSGNKNHVISSKVKTYYTTLTTYIPTLKKMEEQSEETSVIKSKIQSFFDVDSLIDYLIFSDVVTNTDGFRKNWQWVTYNGIKWAVCPYDLDGIFGWNGWGEQSPAMSRLGDNLQLPTGWVIKYFEEELCARYRELRVNILTKQNILTIFCDWCSRIGASNYDNDLSKWPQTPELYSPFKDKHIDNIYRVENWITTRLKKCDEIYKFN